MWKSFFSCSWSNEAGSILPHDIPYSIFFIPRNTGKIYYPLAPLELYKYINGRFVCQSKPETTTKMKTVLFLALSFLLCANAAPDPVLDISGKKLRTGTDYYILPVFRGRGGGLTLASTGNETCPLDVVQEQLEVSNGLPVTFSPVNIKKGVIRVSTDNNIKFSAATICVQSTVWKLANFDDSTQQWFVTSGGVEGNPGRETVDNWFKIEKYEDDYKLVFCPTVCDFCKVMCRDVGIFIDDAGFRRLALSDVPFKVMFRRA